MLSARPVAVLQDEDAAQRQRVDGKNSSKPVRKGLSVITNNSNVPQPALPSSKAVEAPEKNITTGRPRRCAEAIEYSISPSAEPFATDQMFRRRSGLLGQSRTSVEFDSQRQVRSRAWAATGACGRLTVSRCVS